MPNKDAIRDDNQVAVALGVDSTDPTKTLPLLVNDDGALLVEIAESPTPSP